MCKVEYILQFSHCVIVLYFLIFTIFLFLHFLILKF